MTKRILRIYKFTVVVLCLCMVGNLFSIQVAYGQEKLPSDIYRDVEGIPTPFPQQITNNYKGDTHLNRQLKLYEAVTNSENPVLYLSDNTEIATVSSKGFVTAKKAGVVTITLKANETDQYKEATTSIILTIQKGSRTITGVENYTKTAGDRKFSLGVKADDRGEVLYDSSDQKVASVSPQGEVTIGVPGQTTVTASAVETDLYSGAVLKITIGVKPRTVIIKSVKSEKEGNLNVSWTKIKGISGYQVVCAKDPSFKIGKQMKTVNPTATNVAFTGLAKGVPYYVKVRAYKTAKGNTYYGSYSKTINEKVKGLPFFKVYEGKNYYTKYPGTGTGEFVAVKFGKVVNGKIKLKIENGIYNSGYYLWSKTTTGSVQGRTVKFKVNKLFSWETQNDESYICGTDVNIEGTISLVNSKTVQIKSQCPEYPFYDLKFLKANKNKTLIYYAGKPWE